MEVTDVINDLEITDINRDELLRYLGYRGKSIDNETDKLITDCISETIQLTQARYLHRTIKVMCEKDKITLGNTEFSIKSRDLSNLLEHSHLVTILLTTLGPAVDQKIKYYSLTHLERSLILDACAATLIEEVANKVQSMIQKLADPQHYFLTPRFSPGYGDLSLKIQSQIVRYMDATIKIGIDATEGDMLIPSKSISAFLGWAKKEVREKTPLSEFQLLAPEGCKTCIQYYNCYYLRGGTYCDFRKQTLKS